MWQLSNNFLFAALQSVLQGCIVCEVSKVVFPKQFKIHSNTTKLPCSYHWCLLQRTTTGNFWEFARSKCYCSGFVYFLIYKIIFIIFTYISMLWYCLFLYEILHVWHWIAFNLFVLLGDGRNDSPGHSAQYCTYSMMDNESKKYCHSSPWAKDKRKKKVQTWRKHVL